MSDSTWSKVIRAALFTLVPAAYLSMGLWRPFNSYGRFGREGVSPAFLVLMTAVFLVSVLSWKTHRLLAVFGLLACFLWLAVGLLPVL
jgi:hypothetical protein